MFDQCATMEDRIKFVCKCCYFHLHNIAAVRHMLTREACEKLIHAVITSRLDNCNSLLMNVPSTLLQKLQRIQNCAARIVVCKGKRDSIRAILHALHWLPIKQRVEYKVACHAHKRLHDAAPAYLTELLTPYTPTRALCTDSQHLLSQQSSKTKTYSDRAFASCAPRLWNSLPLDIVKYIPPSKLCLTLFLFNSR